jgi:hypothetical protein
MLPFVERGTCAFTAIQYKVIIAASKLGYWNDPKRHGAIEMTDPNPSPSGDSGRSSPGSRKPEAGDSSRFDATRIREETLGKILALGPPQIARLRGEFPVLEHIQVEAAWFGVVIDWFEDRSAMQTEKDGGYFFTLARRRLRDLVASEAARRAREERWSEELSTEQSGPRTPPGEAIAAAESIVQLGEELAELLPTFLKRDERLAYRLWLDGERRTEVFARALDIPATIPLEKQRREVKKVKDRLKKRLRRDTQMKELAEPLKAASDDARKKGIRA